MRSYLGLLGTIPLFKCASSPKPCAALEQWTCFPMVSFYLVGVILFWGVGGGLSTL